VALLKSTCVALLFGALGSMPWARPAVGAEAAEYQVKAVFLFNFSHFVEWPPAALSMPNQPFVICILGEDPFGTRLDEAVRGEQINQHPLAIRRLQSAGDTGECQILYIARSEATHMPAILAALDNRGVLTVADMDQGAERGVMIELATENNRIRLRINVDAARAAGLTISSKLLRPAEIVGTKVKG
jgi:YfiR/HmsC-like